MRFTRHARRSFSTWMVAALLCVQWLVASHACAVSVALPLPVSSPIHAGCTGHHDATAMAAPDDDDAGPAGSPASLCQAHCSAYEQLPTEAGAGSAATPSAGWFIVATVPALDLALAITGEVFQATTAQAGAPPGWPALYLIHQVLRH